MAPLLLSLLLQCVDPPVPPSGFPILEPAAEGVALSDGYLTLAQVRYPDAPPGPCGWPVALLVPWLGANLSVVGGLSQSFAAAGYMAVSFEVRGQGIANLLNLNPGNGTRYYHLRERIDIAEIVAWVGQTYPTLADTDRIGVTGLSQGGVFTWICAAWSGLPFEPNPWNNGSFPVISAIVAEDSSPVLAEQIAPFGVGIMTFIAQMAMGAVPYSTSVDLFPPVEAQIQGAIAGEDYAAWEAFATDPLRDAAARIPAVTTPVMAQVGFEDVHYPSDSLAKWWNLLPASTPKSLNFGPGNGVHLVPFNTEGVAFQASRRRAWFDRFLKGVPNGIDQGPAVSYAVTPADPAVYTSLSSLWVRKSATSWPPAGTILFPLHPRQGGALTGDAPAGAEPDDAIVQTVAPGFDWAALIASGFDLAAVAANVPLQTLVYETAPLAGRLEFAGTPSVHLETDSPGTRFQVRATIYDVDPAGSPRYVTGGSVFVHDNVAPGANAFDFTLNANAYSFAAGNRIRLRLANLAIHDSVGGTEIRYLPYTEPFTVGIRHAAGAATRLDLPVQTEMTVAVAPPSLSIAAGGTATISLDAGVLGAGGIHLVLLSLSGSSPGVPFGPGILPLNPDVQTFFALNLVNTPLYSNFVGVLSPAGTGTATLNLPPGLAAGLEGATLTVAAVLLSPAYGNFPSFNATTLALVP